MPSSALVPPDVVARVQAALRAGEHVALFGAGPGRAAGWLESIGSAAELYDLFDEPAEGVPLHGAVVSLQLAASLSRRGCTVAPFAGPDAVRPPTLAVRISGAEIVDVAEPVPDGGWVRVWSSLPYNSLLGEIAPLPPHGTMGATAGDLPHRRAEGELGNVAEHDEQRDGKRR